MKYINLSSKITVSRIAILGMILALLIALKYALGFIVGVELISFMFIFLGIFLPFVDLTLLISAFNLLVLAIYGFGSWWLMYWIIWPLDAFISKSISKFTTNKYIFAAWGFLAGMSVFFWYFISDMIFYGPNFAFLNIISAIPINMIEGFVTMLGCLIIAPTLAKIFNEYKNKFWPQTKFWKFKENKNILLNRILIGILILLAIAGVILLFVYNQWFINLKESYIEHGDGGYI